MTRLGAIAVATFFLGIGFAGEPLLPMRALAAAIALLVVALILARWTTPVTAFIVAFAGLIGTCYLQHAEYYPGEIIVAFGFAFLAAGSLGWRSTSLQVSGVGAVLGVALFFLR